MNSTQLAPVWVDSPSKLSELVRELKKQTIISVDTESNSLFAYHEKVCLIQFSTSEHDYLVDPLALADLSELAEIFADPRIEKVFHAAEYDIICLTRDYGYTFANLFDTMLAARTAGWKTFGLGSLLEQKFDVLVDKKYQRADWSKRPLSDEQIDYARHDTHYLIALRALLSDELERMGRLGLAQEDFERLTKMKAPDLHDPLTNCWRVAGNHVLEPDQMGVLNAMCGLREELAEAADKPPFKVFSNDLLVGVALELPESLKELEQIKGASRYVSRRFGGQILEAVRMGKQTPAPPRQRHQRPSNAFLRRLEKLREWRKVVARQWEVESDVILPKDILEEIVADNPRKLTELKTAMHDAPWRFTHFGEQILQALTA